MKRGGGGVDTATLRKSSVIISSLLVSILAKRSTCADHKKTSQESVQSIFSRKFADIIFPESTTEGQNKTKGHRQPSSLIGCQI